MNEFTSSILHNLRICYLDATQTKERSYHNWHPTDQFLPLAIEVFGYLHKHVDVFLHDYANAIWSLKRTKGPHLSKASITLQRMQVSSILNRVSYFPTSTPSRHTSHCHGQSIASRQFLTCKYGKPSIGNRLWTCINFHSNFEPTWHLVTSPFFIILLLCTFP